LLGVFHKWCGGFLNSSTNDERMHPYQRRRTSVTGLGL
jgi:hypothetical protein